MELTSSDKKSDSRSIVKPKAQKPVLFTIRLDCLEFRLKTEAGTPVEPYYALLALFDVKNGRKLSEDYHVTVDADGKIVQEKPVISFLLNSHNVCFLKAHKYFQVVRSAADLIYGISCHEGVPYEVVTL